MEISLVCRSAADYEFEEIEFGMVTVLRSNAQGFIQSLRAFWNSGS